MEVVAPMRKMMAVVVFLVLAGVLMAAEPLKSGLQVGDRVSPFEPFNVTGEYAGQEKCLVCHFGGSPVACVFAREMSPPLVTLIKKLDEATAKNSKAEMGSFVCVCTDDTQAMEKDLKRVAKKEGIKMTILALCSEKGPEAYKIAKQADVTVMLYFEGEVKANFAFEKGKLTDKDIEQVVGSLPKILPKN
jgi:hypothetical protein